MLLAAAAALGPCSTTPSSSVKGGSADVVSKPSCSIALVGILVVDLAGSQVGPADVTLIVSVLLLVALSVFVLTVVLLILGNAVGVASVVNYLPRERIKY